MDMNKRAIFALLGFLLLAFGFLSTILGILGIQFVFLGFLQNLSPLMTFLIHLGMAFIGVVIMYLALTDWRE